MCKAVKDPFLGCDSNRVECLTPPLNPHLDDPELMHIPVSSRKTAFTDPEPPSLPGQVCADHELLSVPGATGIHQTPDVDPADPEPSCVPGLFGMKQTPDTDPAVPKPVFVLGSTHFKINYSESLLLQLVIFCSVLFLPRLVILTGVGFSPHQKVINLKG